MKRFIATAGWFIDAVERYPVEGDLGRGIYRRLEFPRETAWTRSPEPLSPEADALRLAR